MTIKQFILNLIEYLKGLLRSLPETGPAPKKLLSHPTAIKTFTHATQGFFKDHYPVGLIVHFTAGRCDTEEDMINSIGWGKDQGYAFWGIGPTGALYQTHTLDKWGHHAGTSEWPELGSKVSQYLLGVEIASAGRVDADGKSWFGKVYDKARLRTGVAKDNCQPGTYVAYTPAQEKTLIDLCIWLKENNPDVFQFKYVLGHDSVSPGRKNDPGWALSQTIPEFQKSLELIYTERKTNA